MVWFLLLVAFILAGNWLGWHIAILGLVALLLLAAIAGQAKA